MLKAQFIYNTEVNMEMEQVPDELVINWDHKGINYIPTSYWTMAEECVNRVETVGTTTNCSLCVFT